MDEEAYQDILDQLKALREGQRDPISAIDELNTRTAAVRMDVAHVKRFTSSKDHWE